jgi:flagellar biogenesis protein FliO
MFCTYLLDSLVQTGEELCQLTEPSLPSGTNLPSGEYGFALIKMFLSLIVVAALLGLTIWFLRRLMRYRFEKSGGVQAIKILEKKMISPKTMLYFVEIEGKKILLAESQLEVRQITFSSHQDSTDRFSEHYPEQ